MVLLCELLLILLLLVGDWFGFLLVLRVQLNLAVGRGLRILDLIASIDLHDLFIGIDHHVLTAVHSLLTPHAVSNALLHALLLILSTVLLISRLMLIIV